jgi:hypothetical protein
MRKSYEAHLQEKRKKALQEVQDRPQRPLTLADFFVPLRQIGAPRRSREDPNNEWLGWVQESDRLIRAWEEGV